MTHHTKKERYLRANLAFILAWLRAMGYIVQKGSPSKSRRPTKRPSKKQLAARRRFAASAKRHHGKVPKKRSS